MSAENQTTFEHESGCLSSNGKQLYLSEKRADFHFVFESPDGMCERLPAHKLLLGVSDVLEAMFNGKWKETDKVTIGDTTAAVFKEFLQFFYLSRVKLTRENVGDVMKLGDMYNVPECVNACEKFMIDTMTNENVCWAYKYAVLFEETASNLTKLKKYCEAVIGIHAKAVIKSKSFLECDHKTLSRILKMDSLRCSEMELFEACLAWVNSAAEQEQLTAKIVKEHLGEAFYDIRFGQMSLQNLAAMDSGSSFFGSDSFDEYKEIIQMMASEKYVPKLFNANRKNRFQKIELNERKIVCVRQSVVLFRPHYIKNIETTVLSSNKPVMLTGFVCEDLSLLTDNNEYDNLGADVPSEVTIVEIPCSVEPMEGHNNELIVYNENVILGTKNTTEVQLNDPILMRPGFKYEIRMKQTPPKKCCTSYALESEMKLGSGIIIKFCDERTNGKEGVVMGVTVNPLYE